jgi:hypothetical protein
LGSGFWDPVVGTNLSWTASLNSGYTISPAVDLIAGFAVYGSNYESEAHQGNTVGLNMIMYGFDLGARINIPTRGKDPEVFKKFR